MFLVFRACRGARILINCGLPLKPPFAVPLPVWHLCGTKEARSVACVAGLNKDGEKESEKIEEREITGK